MAMIFKRIILISTLVVNLVFLNSAHAVNWLLLQGVTEEPYPLVWGFLQPSYFRTSGSSLSAGPWQGQQALANVIQPDLSSSQVFQLQRTRIGVRGALPDAEAISYFLLAEYGNNGITQPGGSDGRVTLTDATVTFSQIKGVRIRVGQMKIPMSEEIYQGIMADNYINLTTLANQQLIERPFWTDGLTNCVTGPTSPAGTSALQYLRFCSGDQDTQMRSSVTPGSDIGIQIFDSLRIGDWEHSYALLVGQGGTNKDNRDDSLDNTLYWSSERIFDGMKVLQKGLKMYAWRTQGKRIIFDSAPLNAGSTTSLEDAQRKYDRKLMGAGATYFDGTYRAAAEYIKVDGMLFVGSTFGAIPGSTNTTGIPGGYAPGEVIAQFRTQPEGKGDGGYLDFGYRVKPNIELDVRYDWYNRATNLTANDEMQFKTWTLGAQYFFNMSTKLIVNYEKREAKNPNLPSSHVINTIAGDVDNRISAQVFLLF